MYTYGKWCLYHQWKQTKPQGRLREGGTRFDSLCNFLLLMVLDLILESHKDYARIKQNGTMGFFSSFFLLMEKCTYRICQISHPRWFIPVEYAITPKDIRLVFLSNETRQPLRPHPWERQMGAGLVLTAWHLYNTHHWGFRSSTVSRGHGVAAIQALSQISMSLLRSPGIAQRTVVFTMQFHIKKWIKKNVYFSPAMFL